MRKDRKMLKLNMTDFIRSLDSLPESNENEPLFGTCLLYTSRCV